MKTHKDGTKPQNGEIFVFGSNLAGRHGAGAAKEALLSCGAKYGIGEGHVGDSYAIPTKDHDIQTMPLSKIVEYVNAFYDYAASTPDNEYFLTRIGCGLANYQDKDIAPMFSPPLDNVNYPDRWVKWLED